MSENENTVAFRYKNLEVVRQPFLDRARAASALTIPSLIPPIDFTTVSDLPTPYQSMGARGVNNLAAKLLLALLPPTTSFFRLTLSEKFRKQLGDDQITAADLALSKMEQAVLREIEHRNIRANAFEAFKHDVVGGNVLIHVDDEKPVSFRFFPLNQYVVVRDPKGNILEIIVKEVVDIDRLPDAVRELVEQIQEKKPDSDGGDRTDVDIYTSVCWNPDEKRWDVYQEVLGEEIEDSRGFYPEDKNPWRPLRWSVVAGQDYGRGHCEEYYGDLSSLDALEKDMLETSAVCASGRWLVNPNSAIDVKELETSQNWSFVEAGPEDIVALQANKFADMQVVAAEINKIEARLNYAFLLHSAVQRAAERVTAEEIRFVASELEDTLGGVYSVMSSEFQLPLVNLLVAQMTKAGSLPALPKGAVEAMVVTGIDALGRNRQDMALDAVLQGAVELFGPQALSFINMSEWFRRKCAARGVDPVNLIKDEATVQAEQAQAVQQQTAQKIGPALVKGVSDNYAQAQQQQQQPQETNQ